MGTAESPAAARRRLRLALRDAREAQKLTQGQVAEALDWSLSKLQRIESGEVTVSRNDLIAALDLFRITDPQRRDQLIRLAKSSKLKGWWDEPRYRPYLTLPLLQLLQFETEATAIRVYHPTLIPGLLQTRAYGDVVLKFWSEELSAQEQTIRLEVRLRRRKSILQRPDPPHYYVVLDESVLHRQVGGLNVMADQLDSMLKMMEQPHVIVRIYPFTADAPLAMLNHFIVLDLADEEDAIVYTERQVSDVIEQTAAAIKPYRHRFEQLWESSLSEDDSKLFIAEMAASLRSPRRRRT